MFCAAAEVVGFFFFLTSDAAIMFENTVLVCVGAQLLLLSDTLQAWSNAGNLFS